jgi:hypothetical protein
MGVAKTKGLREGHSPLGFKLKKQSFFRFFTNAVKVIHSKMKFFAFSFCLFFNF